MLNRITNGIRKNMLVKRMGSESLKYGVLAFVVAVVAVAVFVSMASQEENTEGATFTVSGTVLDGSTAVVGATLAYTIDGTPGSFTTTSAGYMITAPVGSTVEITGVAGYNVSPALPPTFAMTSDNVQDLTVTPAGVE